MIIAVDGTGPKDKPDRVDRFMEKSTAYMRDNIRYKTLSNFIPTNKFKPYTEEMTGSFCRQIGDIPGSIYKRGPTIFGSETSYIAKEVADIIHSHYDKGERDFFLCGYSRGGCAVIIAASLLKQMNHSIRIRGMFLFDAVDLQNSEEEIQRHREISDNVEFVAHVRSKRDPIFWAKNPVRSRFYFINTGVSSARGKQAYDSESYTGTHAALGGVPWVDIKGDHQCAINVAEWMNKRIKNYIDIQLRVIGKSS